MKKSTSGKLRHLATKIVWNVTLLALVFCVSISCEQRAGAPTVILTNGKIITVDEQFSIAEAVAWRNGRIVEVGSTSEVMDLAGDSTTVIDLHGHTVVPGLIEGHAHPIQASQSEVVNAIPVVNSISEVLDWIRHEADVKDDNEWIIHPKFFITRMTDMRQITLRELDEAAPRNPVFLNGSYGGVINSKAMELSKLKGVDHPGILKDERTGKPTGLIRRSVFSRLAIPPQNPMTDDEKSQALKELFQLYNSVGFTSIVSGGGTVEELKAFENLLRNNELTVRVFHNVRVPLDLTKPQNEVTESLKDIGPKTGDGNEWVKMGAFKVVLDGGMLTGTAFLHEPWGTNARDLYGITDPNYRGELMYTKAQLVKIINAACETGWKFTAHVTGGGGVDTLLAAYEQVNESIPLADKRFSIIHGNFFTPEAIKKMAHLGIYADVQPAWFYKDTDLLNHVLGAERISNFHPYQALVDAGVIINAGSDHMVKTDPNLSINPYNPFTAMWSAVTRKTDRNSTFNPEQAISRKEALKMYTINNAYASFEENVKGSIEKGKYADLVVLSKDLLTCHEDSIRNIKPILTVVNGKIVYDNHQLKATPQP